MTPVLIGSITAEGGNLEGSALNNDKDDPEMGSDFIGTGKEGDDLVGTGGGGEVVVLWFFTEEMVAHATTGKIDLVPGVSETSGH